MTDEVLFPDPERASPPAVQERIAADDDFYRHAPEEQILESIMRVEHSLHSGRMLETTFDEHEVRLHEIRPAAAARAIARNWDVEAFEAAICFLATTQAITARPASPSITAIHNALDGIGTTLHFMGLRYCRSNDVIDAAILPWFASVLPSMFADLEAAHNRYFARMERAWDAQRLTPDERRRLERERQRRRPLA
jgi:hypothetical protein